MIGGRCCAGTVCAAAAAIVFSATSTYAQGRNCPVIEDQLITVSAGEPVVFQLSVLQAEGSRVSIFQYPLGGVLERAGPTALDYVFIPTADFAGTTMFTYRLDPPVSCGDGAKLGRVTLAGGPAAGTASGLAVFDPARGLCGVGALPMMAGLSAAMIGLGRRVVPRAGRRESRTMDRPRGVRWG